MIASNIDPFPAADIETNRSGRLSDTQRTSLQGLAREGRKDEFIGAVFCIGIAVLLLAPVGSSPNPWVRPLARARADVCATYPSSLIASITRWRVSSRT